MKNVIKYLPILSVLLIFIGYCHLHFFYSSQFDIDIYQYITTGEIVLSFLPIAFILFLIAICAIFFILISESNEQKNEELVKKPKYIPYTRLMISTGKSYDWTTYYRFKSFEGKKLRLGQKIYLYYKMASHLNFLSVLGLMVGTYFAFRNDWFEDEFLGICALILWMIFIFNLIEKQFHLKVGRTLSENYKNVYTGFILIIGFLISDYIFMYYKAENIKNGGDLNSIKFEYEGKIINTFSDTALLYMGSTQQYVFLYNRKNQNKYLYDKTKAGNIVFGERTSISVLTNINNLKKHLKTACDSIGYYNSLIKDVEKKQLLIHLCDSINKNNSATIKDTLPNNDKDTSLIKE